MIGTKARRRLTSATSHITRSHWVRFLFFISYHFYAQGNKSIHIGVFFFLFFDIILRYKKFFFDLIIIDLSKCT